MGGTKLSYARKAARFLAGELTSRDRLAIVSFDDEVRIVVPSTPVTDPQPIIAAINTIHSGGCTALFDGWRAGATQVAKHLDPTHLNRVLLLSEGQANQALTEQAQIAAKVAGLNQRSISTSAFGLGADFDEDLMGAMAAAGDGTLAQIETPSQLADLYASELQGLATTFGRRVSLGLRGKHQHLSLRLAWDGPGSSERQRLIWHLHLPVLASEELSQLLGHRERKRVIEELDRGDLLLAGASLGKLHSQLMAMPSSPTLTRELDRLSEQMTLLESDPGLSRKRLSRDSQRSRLNVWEGGR